MKKIIVTLLLASVALFATESAANVESGAALYAKKCAICHGAKADEAPITKMKPIAGMKAEKIARVLKLYQDDERYGHGYSEIMKDSTVFLSQKAIDAIATYVSALK
jgi:cytochrome c